MKKIILLLILLIPTIVSAKDKVETIDLSVEIINRGDGNYIYTERHKVNTVFGEKPDTVFYYINIPLKQEIKYLGKKTITNNEIGDVKVSSGHYLNISNDVEDQYTIYIGSGLYLLSENENIELFYEKISEDFNEKDSEVLLISKADYNTKRLTFSLLNFKRNLYKEILFSKDGENFSSEIDNLNYFVDEEEETILGVYNEEMKKGDLLYIMFVGEPSNNEKEVITYSFLILLIFVLFGFVIWFLKKRK